MLAVCKSKGKQPIKHAGKNALGVLEGRIPPSPSVVDCPKPELVQITGAVTGELQAMPRLLRCDSPATNAGAIPEPLSSSRCFARLASSRLETGRRFAADAAAARMVRGGSTDMIYVVVRRVQAQFAQLGFLPPFLGLNYFFLLWLPVLLPVCGETAGAPNAVPPNPPGAVCPKAPPPKPPLT